MAEESLETLAEKAQFRSADKPGCRLFLGRGSPREYLQSEQTAMYVKPLSFEKDGFGPVRILTFDDPYNHEEAYMFKLSAEQIREAVKQQEAINLTAEMATHRGKDAVKKLDLVSTMEDFYQQLLWENENKWLNFQGID